MCVCVSVCLFSCFSGEGGVGGLGGLDGIICFRVKGLVFWNLGGCGFRVWGLGLVQGLRLRV